jgi:hypothetical protein
MGGEKGIESRMPGQINGVIDQFRVISQPAGNGRMRLR